MGSMATSSTAIGGRASTGGSSSPSSSDTTGAISTCAMAMASNAATCAGPGPMPWCMRRGLAVGPVVDGALETAGRPVRQRTGKFVLKLFQRGADCVAQMLEPLLGVQHLHFDVVRQAVRKVRLFHNSSPSSERVRFETGSYQENVLRTKGGNCVQLWTCNWRSASEAMIAAETERFNERRPCAIGIKMRASAPVCT